MSFTFQPCERRIAMFTRIVECYVKREKRQEFADKLQKHVLPILQSQQCFAATPEPPTTGEKKNGKSFCGQEQPRTPPALRFPAGNGWSVEVLGRSQRPFARSRRQTAGHAGRGPSGFVFRF